PAARPLRAGHPGGARLFHLEDDRDALDPVGDRHPLRGRLPHPGRRGALGLPLARDLDRDLSGAAMTGPSVTFLCPVCDGRVAAAGAPRPACPACRAEIELGTGTGFEAGGPLRRCAVCASEALYVAKDFNKNLGLAIVALGSLGFYWGFVPGLLSLVALTVADR